jgi:hypothetical protein
MGYSLRSLNWRYTAWLEFDTNTFLPSLHVPPLAEELYAHLVTGNSSIVANTRQGPRRLSDSPAYSYSSTLGHNELLNVAYNNEYSDVVQHWRLYLYDYLWFNASHAHFFQRRTAEPHEQTNSKVNRDSMKPIFFGRYADSVRPHRRKHAHHYFHYLQQKYAGNEGIVSSNSQASFSGEVSFQYIPPGYTVPMLLSNESGVSRADNSFSARPLSNKSGQDKKHRRKRGPDRGV